MRHIITLFTMLVLVACGGSESTRSAGGDQLSGPSGWTVQVPFSPWRGGG